MSNQPENKFFTSVEAKLIFAATQLDGPQRTKMLGVERKMYHDPDAAELWRIDTINKIHSARFDFDKITIEAAVGQVNKMHGIMTYTPLEDEGNDLDLPD